MKLRHFAIVYEAVMIILVIVSLSTIFSPNPKLENLQTLTWAIFLVDVFIRFIKASTKWKYVKKNPFDILSIIPLEDMFLLGRFARLVRLFRYKNVVKRYLDRIDKLLNNVNFVKLSLIVFTFNFAIALLLCSLTDNSILFSLQYTFLNFFKFNHQSENIDYTFLSIGLKIFGVLYMGVVLNRILNLIKNYYEKAKKSRVESKTENQ